MEIKLESYEIEDALKEYIKNKYDIDVEMFSDYEQPLWLETNERIWVYEKHKNGRIKTDPEHGYKIVDYDKSTWKRKFQSIGDMSSITFEVDLINKEDKK